MVLPLGDPFSVQSLVLVEKAEGAFGSPRGAPTVKLITSVLFVPLTGKGAFGNPRGASGGP